MDIGVLPFLHADQLYDESNCYDVGYVRGSKYDSWRFITCELVTDQGLGAIFMIPFHFLISPHQSYDTVSVLFDENEFQNILFYIDAHEDITFSLGIKVTDLEFPDQITINTSKGDVVFDTPRKNIMTNHNRDNASLDLRESAEIFPYQSSAGQVYRDPNTRNSGGILLKRVDGSWVEYRVKYSRILPFEDNTDILSANAVIWDDGAENTVRYRFGLALTCHVSFSTVIIPESIFDSTKLRRFGMMKNGDAIYGFIDANNEFFEYAHKKYYLTRGDKYGSQSPEEMKASFLEKRDVIFWQDPFGNWIMLTDEKKFRAC